MIRRAWCLVVGHDWRGTYLEGGTFLPLDGGAWSFVCHRCGTRPRWRP